MSGDKESSGKNDERLIEEWPATALAGNDLMSSVLYTMGKKSVYMYSTTTKASALTMPY